MTQSSPGYRSVACEIEDQGREQYKGKEDDYGEIVEVCTLHRTLSYRATLYYYEA